MSHFRFVPKVEYLNDLLIPLGLYPRIRVPEGVSARWPRAVDAARLALILRSQPAPLASSGSASLGVKGLTRPYFFLRFPDFASQWVRSGAGYRFTGGDVEMCIAIKIYVLDSRMPNAPGGDACSEAGFALIMEHEYKHVKDNIDVIHYMSRRALSKPHVRRWLIDRQAMSTAEYRSWIAGYARARTLSDDLWMHPYPGGVRLETSLLSDWAAEHNRRSDLLDSPTGEEMTSFSTRLDDLSRNHQLGRHWQGGAGSDPWHD
jgi:hypothetical protein